MTKAADVFNTLSRSILVDGFDLVLDIEKSKGARIWDSKNQRVLIDFFSFFASNPLGFNHPRMHDKAFEEKLLQYARVKVSNSDIYTTAYAEFVESFHKNVTPMFDKLFFIEGGALGVENCIKTAQDWKVRKNLKAGKGEKGTQVLHFKEAFHGRTGYTMSLTNTIPEKVMYFPKFDWPRVTNPKLHFPLTPESVQNTIALEEQSVREIKQAFEERPDEICAIIIETIQGEGGDNMFRSEFLGKLRELADTYDALLIFDEVQTGMGLTGKFWAFENFNVMPDMISFGKKVQVCGCAVRLKRLEEVDNVFKVPSRINSTWGGNLVDMVRTTQFIDIIIQDRLLDNAKRVGGFIKKELEDIARADDRMTNVRGLGLWLAFDLPDATTRNEFLEKAWESGLAILSCGAKSIRIRPVLDLKEEEAGAGMELIKKTMKELRSTPLKKSSGASA
ncbi:MAG: L-lysine 6-transaminase [Deltaproteobacteria bacterium]|nr:L-lysine 6-transaminase [Deltaproteobacteria bacterium]